MVEKTEIFNDVTFFETFPYMLNNETFPHIYREKGEVWKRQAKLFVPKAQQN